MKIFKKQKRNPLDEITRIQLVKYLADAEKNGSYSSLKHALFILENNGDICKNCSNLYGEDLCDCYTCPRDYDEYEEPCEDIDFCVCDLFDGQPKKKEIKEYANELINSVLTEEEIYRVVVLGNGDLQNDLRLTLVTIPYFNYIALDDLEKIYSKYKLIKRKNINVYKFFINDLSNLLNKLNEYKEKDTTYISIPVLKKPREILNIIFNFQYKYGLSPEDFDDLMNEIFWNFKNYPEYYIITSSSKQFFDYFVHLIENDELKNKFKSFLKKQNPNIKKKRQLNLKKSIW